METLNENELKLFVESVRLYFKKLTREEPLITSAFLATGDLQGYDYNGIVTFSGAYNGHVIVSMPGPLLRELLLLQGENDLSQANLLDAVGEIANTLAGNARKHFGGDMEISVPKTAAGAIGNSGSRKRPYVIMVSWKTYSASLVVDIERLD